MEGTCRAKCDPPCGRPVKSRGLCMAHYVAMWIRGAGFDWGPDDMTEVDADPVRSVGRPRLESRGGCSAKCDPPCPRPVVAHGLCMGHYVRKRRGLDVDVPLRSRRKA